MTGSLRIEPLQYASIKNTPSKSRKDKLHGEIFNLADSHHVRLFISRTSGFLYFCFALLQVINTLILLSYVRLWANYIEFNVSFLIHNFHIVLHRKAAYTQIHNKKQRNTTE